MATANITSTSTKDWTPTAYQQVDADVTTNPLTGATYKAAVVANPNATFTGVGVNPASANVTDSTYAYRDATQVAPININAFDKFQTQYDVPKQFKDNATVQGQMNQIIANDSPLMQQAATRAKQNANSRGLLNTSMAVGAGQTALLDAAMPMAQQDASAYGNWISRERGSQIQDELAGLQAQKDDALRNQDYTRSYQLNEREKQLQFEYANYQAQVQGDLNEQQTSNTGLLNNQQGELTNNAANNDLLRAGVLAEQSSNNRIGELGQENTWRDQLANNDLTRDITKANVVGEIERNRDNATRSFDEWSANFTANANDDKQLLEYEQRTFENYRQEIANLRPENFATDADYKNAIKAVNVSYLGNPYFQFEQTWDAIDGVDPVDGAVSKGQLQKLETVMIKGKPVDVVYNDSLNLFIDEKTGDLFAPRVEPDGTVSWSASQDGGNNYYSVWDNELSPYSDEYQASLNATGTTTGTTTTDTTTGGTGGSTSTNTGTTTGTTTGTGTPGTTTGSTTTGAGTTAPYDPLGTSNSALVTDNANGNNTTVPKTTVQTQQGEITAKSNYSFNKSGTNGGLMLEFNLSDKATKAFGSPIYEQVTKNANGVDVKTQYQMIGGIPVPITAAGKFGANTVPTFIEALNGKATVVSTTGTLGSKDAITTIKSNGLNYKVTADGAITRTIGTGTTAKTLTLARNNNTGATPIPTGVEPKLRDYAGRDIGYLGDLSGTPVYGTADNMYMKFGAFTLPVVETGASLDVSGVNLFTARINGVQTKLDVTGITANATNGDVLTFADEAKNVYTLNTKTNTWTAGAKTEIGKDIAADSTSLKALTTALTTATTAKTAAETKLTAATKAANILSDQYNALQNAGTPAQISALATKLRDAQDATATAQAAYNTSLTAFNTANTNKSEFDTQYATKKSGWDAGLLAQARANDGLA